MRIRESVRPRHPPAARRNAPQKGAQRLVRCVTAHLVRREEDDAHGSTRGAHTHEDALSSPESRQHGGWRERQCVAGASAATGDCAVALGAAKHRGPPGRRGTKAGPHAYTPSWVAREARKDGGDSTTSSRDSPWTSTAGTPLASSSYTGLGATPTRAAATLESRVIQRSGGCRWGCFCFYISQDEVRMEARGALFIASTHTDLLERCACEFSFLFLRAYSPRAMGRR